MQDKPISDDHELIECSTCLQEVPLSEANNAEAVDYVAHFCGLECYDKWRELEEKNSAEAEKES